MATPPSTPPLPHGGIYIAIDSAGRMRAWAGAGAELPTAPPDFPIGPFFSAEELRKAHAEGFAAGVTSVTGPAA